MHTVRQLLVPQLAALLFLAACNNIPSAADMKKSVQAQKPATEYFAADSTASSTPDTAKIPVSNSATYQDWDKRIVKNASLVLEVKNFKTFNDQLHAGVKESGGYISQEEQTQSDYRIENVLTIRVPVAQFDNAVDRITPGGKLVEKKINADDVTGELVDTKSRLETRKMVRLRYLDMLKQAKSRQEILEVQNEINSMQEQEEAAAGRIQYLSHASSYSTIHLTFYELLNGSTGTTAPEPSFGTRILEAFTNGVKWIGGLLVTLVPIWPLWLSIAIAWWIIKRYRAGLAKKA
ncbi:MAG: DUF4349 domain-containing protein [Bacteroidetes bacterium]|nr:DUF4349 domain-containing protein [Bacteroidota bacterium]